MSLLNLPLMNAITADMQWRDQNMKVIAGNVANADTPGAKARGLKELDFKALLGSMAGGGSGKLSMATTTDTHFPKTNMAGAGGAAAKAVTNPVTYEVNPDDNKIILEEQLLAGQKNASQYNLAVNMYRKNINMLKLAAGINR